MEDRPKEQGAVSQVHIAWRMIIELVTGVGMGVVAGFGLDYLFGTAPVLLIILTLVGFAAGVKLMLRTAREIGSSDATRQASSGS